MEKILFIIDSKRIDANAMKFACYIAKLTRSKLTATFLEYFGEEKRPVMKQLYGAAVVETIISRNLPDNKINRLNLEENITLFKEACIKSGVSSSIHRTKVEPIQELINESRFVDLMILGASISERGEAVGLPDLVKKLLVESECPIIIAPLDFDSIDEILFAYDGSASSLFAIKQFTYLFPELQDKKAIVLQVNKKGHTDIERENKIKDLLSPHYSNIGFKVLEGSVDDELLGFLLGKKKIFLVMGAFGRSFFSNLLVPSHSELILKSANLPVFIAHR